MFVIDRFRPRALNFHKVVCAVSRRSTNEKPSEHMLNFIFNQNFFVKNSSIIAQPMRPFFRELQPLPWENVQQQGRVHASSCLWLQFYELPQESGKSGENVHIQVIS